MPPRLARLLAVVVAAGLVAGAFVVRGVLTDDDGGEQVVMPGSDQPTADGERYRIACDADLGEQACEAVAGVAGVDEVVMVAWADVRDDEDLPYDAWLTLDPMPAVLDQVRPGVLTGEPAAVASSPLALLTRDEDVDCAEWACILDGKIGVPGRDTSAGVVIASGVYTGLAGPDEVETRGIGVFEDDAEVRDGLRDLTDELDLERQEAKLVTQVGSYAGVVTIGGRADLRIERNPAAGLERVLLDPEVVVGVVLAGIGGKGGPAVEALGDALKGKTVRDALGAGGWTGAPGRSAGLPDADVIYRLQEELGS